MQMSHHQCSNICQIMFTVKFLIILSFTKVPNYVSKNNEHKNKNKRNKPTCARVAAMTTWAPNKSKQHSFNAKFLLLPFATLHLMLITLITCFEKSLEIPIKCSNMLSICLECLFNMLHTCSQHASNEHC